MSNRLPAALLFLAGLACLQCATSQQSHAPNELVEIEYIAHAAFTITAADGASVLVDPYQSRWWLGFDFPPPLRDIDAVLLSHPHPDHDAGYANGSEVPWSQDTIVVDKPGRFQFGAIAVTGLAGKHAEPYGEEFGRKNIVWLIEVAGLRIVHLGDNEPINDRLAADLGDVDVLMIPVDDIEHILSFEAVAEYQRRLSPEVVIPMHYRHPDLETEASSPSALGPIDQWFSRQENQRRLGTHKVTMSKNQLSAEPRVWLFDHSPRAGPPTQ